MCLSAQRGCGVIQTVGRKMRTGARFAVSDEQRRQLKAVANDGNSKQKHVMRARIILLSDEGLGTMAVATGTGSTEATVRRWRKRFMEEGVEGLLRDETPKPGKPPMPEATVRGNVSRNRIAPKRWRHSKLSTDAIFAAKVRDIAGFYMNPPDRAVVLSVHAITWSQARKRTGKGMPMKSGQPAATAFDRKRQKIVNLAAAMNILDGMVVECHAERRRNREFIEFLEKTEAVVAADKCIHAIVDNSITLKHEVAREWLGEHERWIFHTAPTTCSWVYAAGNFFGMLSRHPLGRGVHDSVEQLESAIMDFIEQNNGEEAKPFSWTASPKRPIAARQGGPSD